MADFYRQVCQQLRMAGYEKVAGGKGSHEKWHNPQLDRTFIVPHNLKKRHTANVIMKSADLTKNF